MPAVIDAASPVLPPAARESSSWASLAASGLIVLAVAAAFSNSFAGPFIFDDVKAITDNPTIRQLWPIWPALRPPQERGDTVAGRPLLNLSLAVNYAMSGYDVRSYHATNLVIHVLVALLLFGIVRRTFLLPAMRDRWGAAAVPLALATALLWAIHPLQTESVTYIVQRAESLMGMFYLLTLYCFIRGVGSGLPLPKREGIVWYAGSVLACLSGMACKEVMVSAPLVVLLYDRTFCAGSFGQAWRRRKAFYLSLAGAWLLLGWLMAATGSRGGSVGPSVRQFTCWSYPLTEAGVILHYLRLSAWPTGLCLDYGWPPPRTVAAALVPAVLVAGLVGLTGWALLKRSAWGFVGAWFFLILAPTSSFVPVLDAAFEHRMYLALAAVATGLVAAGWVVGREIVHRGIISLRASRLIGGALVIFACLALGILTFDRNRDYQSALAIWEDTAAKAPENGRAQYNLGMTLVACGRSDAAIASFAKAVELTPRHAEAHNGLGNVLFNSGQVAAAIEHYRAALEIKPDFAEAHNNLGLALAQEGLYDEAITHFQKAMALKPDFADACRNLLVALSKKGQAR